MTRRHRSPVFVIFTTVVVDLIGFGMVIPLVGLYGKHYGATGLELPVLGGVYSLMQFAFAPFWGSLSDRIGRRPVLLTSIAGLGLSYLGFALAPSYGWLLASRALGGLFAANVSTAQAYMADVTTPEERAKGMGLIGAAFGIGFTLGPPIGGIAAAHFGLAAPGLIAASICAVNWVVALFRLEESLPPEIRARKGSRRSLLPLDPSALTRSLRVPEQGFLFLAFFLVTFAFSNMEQTFSLLFQEKFHFPTGEAGYRTGMILMVSSVVGAVVQGGLIRSLVPRFGERRILLCGLALNGFAMLIFPYGPTYAAYFLITIPMALGSALINPSLSSLISRSAGPSEQGAILGMSQGLGSLARALGPFCGLLTFALSPALPYQIATAISVLLLLVSLRVFRGKTSAIRPAGAEITQ